MVVLLGALALVCATPAGAVKITEFPIEAGAPANKHVPLYIINGPGGDLWFADRGTGGGIGRMTTSGASAVQPVTGIPVDLALSSDGTLFWTAESTIGRRTPTGVFRPDTQHSSDSYAIAIVGTLAAWTEKRSGDDSAFCAFGDNCALASTIPPLTDITLDASNRQWIAALEANQVLIHTRDPSGHHYSFIDLPLNSGPMRIAAGPDGNMWVAELRANAIDRITPDRQLLPRFQLPGNPGPHDIVAGPDGALWFTEIGSSSIGRITTTGQYNTFPVPTVGSHPAGITVGSDGAIWFTELTVGKLGRLQLDPPAPGGGGGGGGPGGTGGFSDTFVPRFVRGLSFVPSRFRRTSRSLPYSAATRPRLAPAGSSMRFSLSEPATVTVLLERRASGRRVGRSCLAPTRARRSRPRCTRYLRNRTLTRKAVAGVNQVAFSGRFGGRNLPLGGYRATARARDAAGNLSRPSVATLTLVATR